MTSLRALVARVQQFYDPTREPLRRSVYTFLLGVAALLASAGLITGTVAIGIGGPLALLLAVPAVEHARSKVTPVADPDLTDTPGRHALDFPR